MQVFSKILVTVDSSQETHPELERAMALADQFQAELFLIDTVGDLSPTLRYLSRDYAHLHEEHMHEKRQAIDGLVQLCRSHGIQASGQVIAGHSSEAGIRECRRIGADLAIRLAKGVHSHARGSIGMSARKLLRNPPCNIWLCQPPHEPTCSTIIAAVDATPNDTAHADLNRRILDAARELAKRERCRLTVAYAWQMDAAEFIRHRIPEREFEQLEKMSRREQIESFEALLSDYGLHAMGPEARFIEGEPSLAIPELCISEKADLLVCGTVARRGISGLLLGNTAERMIDRVECSVLAITPGNALVDVA